MDLLLGHIFQLHGKNAEDLAAKRKREQQIERSGAGKSRQVPTAPLLRLQLHFVSEYRASQAGQSGRELLAQGQLLGSLGCDSSRQSEVVTGHRHIPRLEELEEVAHNLWGCLEVCLVLTFKLRDHVVAQKLPNHGRQLRAELAETVFQLELFLVLSVRDLAVDVIFIRL